MVVLLVVCNMMVYSLVVLLVVRELTAAITGSQVGYPIDFRGIFGRFSWRRKMDDRFSAWRKRKSPQFC
jgi:hypothetical protein